MTWVEMPMENSLHVAARNRLELVFIAPLKPVQLFDCFKKIKINSVFSTLLRPGARYALQLSIRRD